MVPTLRRSVMATSGGSGMTSYSKTPCWMTAIPPARTAPLAGQVGEAVSVPPSDVTGRESRRGTERRQVPDVSFIHQTKPKSATSDVAVIDNEFERLGLGPWIAQLTEPPAQTWNLVPL